MSKCFLSPRRPSLEGNQGYPLRYNQLVSDLTEETVGERIIWARSAWAGNQRYPLHWGGDVENTYSAMAGTL